MSRVPGSTPLETPFASPGAAGLQVPTRAAARLLDGGLDAVKPKDLRRRGGGGVVGVGDGRRGGARASSAAALEKLRIPSARTRRRAGGWLKPRRPWGSEMAAAQPRPRPRRCSSLEAYLFRQGRPGRCVASERPDRRTASQPPQTSAALPAHGPAARKTARPALGPAPARSGRRSGGGDDDSYAGSNLHGSGKVAHSTVGSDEVRPHHDDCGERWLSSRRRRRNKERRFPDFFQLPMGRPRAFSGDEPRRQGVEADGVDHARERRAMARSRRRRLGVTAASGMASFSQRRATG